MAALAVNALTYLVVCGALVAGWTLVQGSVQDLVDVVEDPTQWKALGFWPIWVILGWGTALLVHAAVAVPVAVFGRRRRREKRMLREAKLEARIRRTLATASPGGVPTDPDVPIEAVTVDPKGGQASATRQWVTVLFVDIAGSTSLNEALGDEAWSRCLVDFRALVRSRVLSRGGSEVGTQGDGLLARFPSPADAVLCSIDIQRDVREQMTEPAPLSVRIGVNAGEVVHDDGDLIGRVINLAARVTGQAEPGEILVTEPVAEYVGSRLRLEDRGLHDLKGIPQPRHLLAVDWADDSEVPADSGRGGAES